MQECKLTNERGKAIAMGSRDQMFQYLKHHVGDGIYAIVGPNIDMVYYRDAGIVYPSGGMQDCEKMPPRTLEECKRVFVIADEEV
jgi:hypothetical protein